RAVRRRSAAARLAGQVRRGPGGGVRGVAVLQWPRRCGAEERRVSTALGRGGGAARAVSGSHSNPGGGLEVVADARLPACPVADLRALVSRAGDAGRRTTRQSTPPDPASRSPRSRQPGRAAAFAGAIPEPGT